LKESWPQASAAKDKRSARLQEETKTTGEARNDKSGPRQEHRHGGPCPLKQELAAGQRFKRQAPDDRRDYRRSME
jgi:hypothetical protein